MTTEPRVCACSLTGEVHVVRDGKFCEIHEEGQDLPVSAETMEAVVLGYKAKMIENSGPDDLLRRIEDIYHREGWSLPGLPAVALRLLDEVVELCLASGLGSGTILEGVADALSREAAKTGTQVSGLVGTEAIYEDVVDELADVSLQALWATWRSGVHGPAVRAAARRKVAALEHEAREGTLDVRADGIFRRMRKGP